MYPKNGLTILELLSKDCQKQIAICAQKPSKKNHKMCSNESYNWGGCTKFHQEYIHTSCTKRSHSGCLPSHSSNGLVGVAHQAISTWPYNTGKKKSAISQTFSIWHSYYLQPSPCKAQTWYGLNPLEKII